MKKILIVEDEKLISNVLGLKLQREGYAVTIVDNGALALEQLAQTTFDLIILDLIMPVVNGFGVLEKINEMKITTPIIVSSNLGQPEDINKAKELGVMEYFVKADVSLATIVDYINKYFGSTQ